MKPDFDTMSTTELRAYLLSHREDEEAFHKLVDRFEIDSENTKVYPCPDTPENIAIMEDAIRDRIKKLEKEQKK